MTTMYYKRECWILRGGRDCPYYWHSWTDNAEIGDFVSYACAMEWAREHEASITHE